MVVFAKNGVWLSAFLTEVASSKKEVDFKWGFKLVFICRKIWPIYMLYVNTIIVE